MIGILYRIQQLASAGQVRVSGHGYDELANDDLLAGEVLAGLPGAVTVEEYPDYPKGPCVLVLQHDNLGQAIHVLWGIAKGTVGPAVLVTAYRPDPKKWKDPLHRRES